MSTIGDRLGHLVVDVRDVSRNYKRGPEVVHALEHASLQLVAGEVVALVGPSGSGKTTLLNILIGWEKPDGGQLTWGFGDPNLPPDRHAWAEVSVLPQSLGLLEELSVRENVELPLRLSNATSDGVKRRAESLLEELGLAKFAHRAPSEISIGEQQRTALARALVLRPRLLLADEPSGHQDAGWAEGVWGVVRSAAAEGTACFIATHNEEFLSLADRILAIRDGHVHSVESLADLHRH